MFSYIYNNFYIVRIIDSMRNKNGFCLRFNSIFNKMGINIVSVYFVIYKNRY